MLHIFYLIDVYVEVLVDKELSSNNRYNPPKKGRGRGWRERRRDMTTHLSHLSSSRLFFCIDFRIVY